MQLCKMPHLIPLDPPFRSASHGSSQSDEENNKAEGSQCGPRPGPHEYANERDDRSSDESSEGDGMISHRCLPWGRDLSICHSQTSELKGHTMALAMGGR